MQPGTGAVVTSKGCSAVRDLLRRESVGKLKEKLPRMILTQTCLLFSALTLPFTSLSWPLGFTFHLTAMSPLVSVKSLLFMAEFSEKERY